MAPPPYTMRPASLLYRGRFFFAESDSDGEQGCRLRVVGSHTLSGSSTILPSTTFRSFWIDRPLGVYHLAVVSFSAQPPSSVNSDCTSPLPNDVVPTTSARSWS